MRLFSFMAAIIAAVIVSWLNPPSASAWSAQGHLTICDLAYRNLTPASREALIELFQSKGKGVVIPARGKTEARTYTSFNIGCLEEDELPRRHPDDHFINVDRDVRSIDTEVCPREGNCILSGIRRDFEILRDRSRSREDRVFALMALGHWVGDVHQPLHVSFKDDRGGNYITARTEGRCGTSTYRATNLHAVWDNCILQAGLFERVRQRADYRSSWGPNTITYRAVDTLQANTSLAEEISYVGSDARPWVNDPWRWANESYQITLNPNTLYCTRQGANCRYEDGRLTLPQGSDESDYRRVTIPQSYLRAHDAVAQERVRRAGFRLAHLINLALDPAYSRPVRNSTQRQ